MVVFGGLVASWLELPRSWLWGFAERNGGAGALAVRAVVGLWMGAVAALGAGLTVSAGFTSPA